MEIDGKRLTELRERAGLSGAELARKVGISGRYVYALERGERGKSPRVDTVDKLAAALGLDDPRDLLRNAR